VPAVMPAALVMPVLPVVPVVPVLPVMPVVAVAATGASDLPALQTRLTSANADVARLAAELEQRAAADSELRVEVEREQATQQRAQQRLDARARTVWMTQLPAGLSTWTALTRGDAVRLAVRGPAAALRTDAGLLAAAGDRSSAGQALRQHAAAYRARLTGRAVAASAAQDRARALLTEAELAVAAAQAQAARRTAAQAASRAAQAEQRRLAEQAAAIAATRRALDATSASVTRALTGRQTLRGAGAVGAQAPVLALLTAAGAGYPAGYRPTGQVLAGLASWYGPGFVGSPTASGAPYDPELLTCANKELPLGTVVRVSANGHAVNCLITDRGPYVGPRILDMSRAGSRALGYDGVASVVIEVLAPS